MLEQRVLLIALLDVASIGGTVMDSLIRSHLFLYPYIFLVARRRRDFAGGVQGDRVASEPWRVRLGAVR